MGALIEIKRSAKAPGRPGASNGVQRGALAMEPSATSALQRITDLGPTSR